MATVIHLKALQALEMAIREGSLKAAADALGITPAAVGQRIRTLEVYLGTDLLMRGRSGLQPTLELEQAMADLRLAFAALERATLSLDFQRVSEIHIVADPDWAELWLLPRIGAFRAARPNIQFCINGEGDVPVRLGAPDLRVTYGDGPGEPLFRDVFLPVTGPDNPRRIADRDPVMQMEGMPLLHLKSQREADDVPGWVAWFRTFSQREKGPHRGVSYQNVRLALQAVRKDVGFLVCGLSFVLGDLKDGSIVLPFPPSHHVPAPHPYRMALRQDAENRPQVAKFLTWLRNEASASINQIETWTKSAAKGSTG